MRQRIELLSPAKNLACGMAAIDHGADAVYIGAERFGARQAAGNTLDDIAALCRYAHPFGAKVYVTVNTVVYDEELETTRALLDELQQIGVDAILVQDMGMMREEREILKEERGMQWHASTQTDNRTPEKVRWLRSLGFRRVVLARELSVEEIREIHRQVPDVELEVFVHGALCVSYSGQCYASEYCFGRSANRGACAQFCRLPFDLVDADGKVIAHDRHLLSLKDLSQIDRLEELMEAGAVSFKIEGRLKDVDYVKNVTAAYSQRLNQLISRHPDRYERASRGRVDYRFEPDLKKTFNRGFTHYFLDAHWHDGRLEGRRQDIFSPDTPKALGENVGRVKELRRDSLTVAGTASFSNGDGLCFFSPQLEGFRVNRAEGNRLFPYKMPEGLRPGMVLYRNNDVAFERLMGGTTAVRKLPLCMTMEAVEGGFRLSITEKNTKCSAEKNTMSAMSACSRFFAAEHQEAQKPQRENIVRQLSKLGDTPYVLDRVDFIPEDFNYFIPSSMLAAWRRELVETFAEMAEKSLDESLLAEGTKEGSVATGVEEMPVPQSALTKAYPYLYNAANEAARGFYRERGVAEACGFERRQHADGDALLMQCRHCLRFSLGACRKQGGKAVGWKEPLSLVSADGRRFRLEFDCRACQMNVYGGA